VDKQPPAFPRESSDRAWSHGRIGLSVWPGEER